MEEQGMVGDSGVPVGDYAGVENRRRSKAVGVVAGVAIIALLVGVCGVAMASVSLKKPAEKDDTAQQHGVDGYYNGDGVISVAETARKITPSVVSIYTENSQGQGGEGTGFIVSSDGLVVTNKHVADGMAQLAVELDNGDYSEQVQVLGVDPLNDVAYLKVSGFTNMKAATLGDSRNNLVGMPVLAVGYALGQYPNTVTMGVISGLSRQVTANTQTGEVYEALTDLIQTDAAVNPGNSGGPLVNGAGEVVGVNVAASQGVQNINFAIPINAIKGMLKNIQQNGRAERADMGLSYAPINSQLAYEQDLPVRHGALIMGATEGQSGIVAGGPAAQAGLRDGDIITAVDGTEIGTKGSLLTLVSEYMPGERVSFTVLRGSEELMIDVTLGTYSANQTR